MDLGEAVMVAGIGCRAKVAADAVIAAIDAALATCGSDRSALRALAVVPQKSGEGGIEDAARALGLPLIVAEEGALARVQTLTVSAKSRAATGTGSAAEAAALAVAGEQARLLGPRVAVGAVTCALAVSEAAR